MGRTVFFLLGSDVATVKTMAAARLARPMRPQQRVEHSIHANIGRVEISLKHPWQLPQCISKVVKRPNQKSLDKPDGEPNNQGRKIKSAGN